MEDYSKIILGTGNYENVKSGNTVSITGDGGNAWGYYGRTFKKLAPRLKTYEEYINNIDFLRNLSLELDEYKKEVKRIEDEYIKSYYETRLQDVYIYDLLEEMHRRFGNNIILLCHEPIDEFCHRRVLADYIELETGMYIPEVSVDEDYNIKKLKPIRYKNRINNIINKI